MNNTARAVAAATIWLTICTIAYTTAQRMVTSTSLHVVAGGGRVAVLPAMPWLLIFGTKQLTLSLWAGYITNAGCVVFFQKRLLGNIARRNSDGEKTGMFGRGYRNRFPRWDDD